MFFKHKTLCWLLLLCMMSATVSKITRNSTYSYGTFARVYVEKFLSSSPIERYYVKSLLECTRYCVQNKNCKSFNFGHMVEIIFCDLLPENRLDSTKFIHFVGLNYYDAELIFPSCKSALKTFNSDGIYQIQPDERYKPFNVTCKKDDGLFMSVISHDRNADLLVNGPELCPGNPIPITYHNVPDINALISLVDRSDKCQQKAKMICRNAQPLYQSDRKSACYGATDRHGNIIGYWAGGNSNTFCKCGLDRTCVSATNECNCDSTDAYSTYQDEGVYDNKTLLPLRGIIASDTGHYSEWLKVSMGKLICWEA